MTYDVLDIWAHVLPPMYFERISALLSGPGVSLRISGHLPWLNEFPALVDLDARWRALDGIDDYQQILVLAVPPLEELGDAALCSDLARLANDEMAELVRMYPDRFAGFAAALPLNDVEASLNELERAVRTLGALGAQVYSPVVGRPLDDPRFEPLFAKVAALGGAVWLHPTRGKETADYETETSSRFGLWFALGWPYETSVAMARLVFSGIVASYPGLPFITHHGGGMVPQFPDRLVELALEEIDNVTPQTRHDLTGQLRTFYADTVVGPEAGLRNSIEFFGIEHVLFATDMPFGAPTMVSEKIGQIHALRLSEVDTRSIFSGNARRMLRLA